MEPSNSSRNGASVRSGQGTQVSYEGLAWTTGEPTHGSINACPLRTCSGPHGACFGNADAHSLAYLSIPCMLTDTLQSSGCFQCTCMPQSLVRLRYTLLIFLLRFHFPLMFVVDSRLATREKKFNQNTAPCT